MTCIHVDMEDIFGKENEDGEVERRVEDVIDGGQNPSGKENSDTLSFEDWVDSQYNQGVTVNLDARTVTHNGVTVTRVFKNIEHIIGSRYEDDLTGDNGNNIIEGGADNDELDGGDGNDTVSYRSSNAGVTINLENNNAEGGHAAGDTISNFKNIIGSAHADILTGSDGQENIIEGGAGGDTLDGGTGGTNTLSYESSNASVDIDLGQGEDETIGGNPVTLIKKSTGGHASNDNVIHNTFQNIIGSRHSDTLTGNGENNTLKGGVGNDMLKGEDGNDTLEGGPGRDTLDGGDGTTDTATYADATAAVTVDLTGGSGGRGDAAGDRFISIDNFVGSTYDDTFIASEDPDNIDGGAHGEGGDTVSYEKSGVGVTVSLPGAQTDMTTDSYAIGDTLTNIENVTGSRHEDTLTGDNGDNTLKGGAGDDTLKGESGADTLEGGRGDDTLDAGSDSQTDTLKFASGDGDDEIRNFTPDQDKIDLSAFSSIKSFDDLEMRSTNNDANTEIDLPGGGEITLVSVSMDRLDADNFMFRTRIITGTDGNNTLNGDNNPNTIRGGKGDDRLFGRDGNDVLYGGDGDDQLTGGDGMDTLHGGKGSDTFFITYEEDIDEIVIFDTVYGEGDLDEDGDVTDETDEDSASEDTISYKDWVNADGSDTGIILELDSNSDNVDGIENIIGSRHEDDFTGDSRENIIEGGADNDELDGGDGNDTVSYRSSNAGVTINLENNNAEGGHAAGDTISNFENIIGSAHADILTGSDGQENIIEGGAGGDTLDGGTGGTNTLSYESSNASVDIDLGQGEDETIGGNPVTLIKKSTGGHASNDNVIHNTFQNIIGSRHSDTLTGNGENNTLKGGVGNDMLKGEDGNDTLEGGPGRDTLDGGDGTTDTATYADATAAVTVDLTGGSGGRGDAAGDRFISIDNFVGSTYDDTFIASEDPDNIDGGAHGEGGDTVSYEKSGVGVTVSLPGAQTDMTTDSYAVGDTLNNIENIIGSDYNDTLTGDSSANTLQGGKGDDTLDAGSDNQTDTLKFASGDGDDEIRNFSTNEDNIDLTAFTSVASMDDLNIRSTNNDANTEIDLPGGGEITIVGVRITDLDADNFIFYQSVINGTSGSNTLKGDLRGNEINAGAGNDQVFGNGGRDVLNGEAGDDTMYGGEDNDILNGGEGDDILDGGPGADTFVFTPGHEDDHDYIVDFNRSGDTSNETDHDDMIDLTAFDNVDTSDMTPGDGNHVIVLPDDGGTITVLGVGDNALTDGDFI